MSNLIRETSNGRRLAQDVVDHPYEPAGIDICQTGLTAGRYPRPRDVHLLHMMSSRHEVRVARAASNVRVEAASASWEIVKMNVLRMTGQSTTLPSASTTMFHTV
jgi:hypothetical protein